MTFRPLQHLRSNAVAYAALFVALSGTAWAAATINSGDVVDESLKSKDLKDNKAVGGSDVIDGSLSGPDVDEEGLEHLLEQTTQSGFYADAVEDPLAELDGASLEIHDDGAVDTTTEVVVEHTGAGGDYHVVKDDSTVVTVTPSSSQTIASTDNLLDFMVIGSGYGGAADESISVHCGFDPEFDEGAADKPVVVCFATKPLIR